MIIFSLLDEPNERRLPLPDAAESPNQSVDSETLAIQLRHHHLPKLAEPGYVRWEDVPFYVQPGPNFDEPTLVVGKIAESADDIPESLVNNCRFLRELDDDDSN
jgi:hypothetical protein